MAKRLKYIYQYRCGCSDGPKWPSEMLKYCGKHGEGLLQKYPDLSFMTTPKHATEWKCKSCGFKNNPNRSVCLGCQKEKQP